MKYVFTHNPLLAPLPEMDWREGKVFWAGNQIPVDMEALVRAGYFTAHPTYDYGADVETLVVDSLPAAFHGSLTDWRQRAQAFITAVEARGWKIVPAEDERQ